MKTGEKKEQYAPPRCEELDARLEGVIAASGGAESTPSWGTESWTEG